MAHDPSEMRRLKGQAAKVKALQDALIAGEQSGEPRPFDFEEFKARKRAEHVGKLEATRGKS